MNISSKISQDILNSQEEVDEVEIVRTKMWNNRKNEHGPFDVIGDVHGCFDELVMLLRKLGYEDNEEAGMIHPEGRKPVFLGDLCDRGPKNVEVLRLVMKMVKSGNALAVPGNHDVKLVKYLLGKNVQLTHGLDKTVEELEKQDEQFRNDVREFLDGLVSHYVLDDGKLVVSHAGLKQEYIGRGSMKVRDFCLYTAGKLIRSMICELLRSICLPVRATCSPERSTSGIWKRSSSTAPA